ncbi:hypothetical protein JA1_004964 [Spathaspora sp. JA1]|nr:hypothetical protein JA1_004964 [Spathaspora sp. JA1]
MSAPVVPSRTCEDWKQTFHGFWPGKPSFKEDKYPSLEGKVVIVTGGNTGVGYETVKSLAGSTKAKLYIFSRSEEKTLAAIKQIQLEVAKEYNVPNRDINFIKVDLSDLETIKPAVQKFLSQESRLDLIIHNAGVMTPPVGSESKQGYELQLGTNVLGPHLLQRLLDPIFIETSKKNAPGESRIVWVASSAHLSAPLGGFHWADLNFEKLKSPSMNEQMMIYGQSKAGNVIQARTWTRKHNTGSQIISSSVCPGFLSTDLQRNTPYLLTLLGKLLLHPRRMGAYTELFAAFSPDVKDGSHSISFGVPSYARKDIIEDEACDKAWNFFTEATDPYITWQDWKQVLHGFWPGKPSFKEDKYPSLEGKVVIVTGGNTGVGYETVKSLAGSTKAKLYILSRSEEKTLEAIKQMQLEVAKEYNVSNRDINFIKVDLSDLETIKPAVQKFLSQESRLDLIIHNAGVMMPPVGSKSKQGYELQLGTNVVGPHLLQRLLDPIFIETSKKNAPGQSRIVWVASTAHQLAPLGGFHWADLNFDKLKNISKNDQMTIYGQSKAGNVIQARTWTRKHNTGSQIISSSLCPGYLDTDLQRHASFMEKIIYSLTLHPRRMGAYTELFAAFSPDVKDGSHSISFGTQSHARKDIIQDEACDKVWDFLTEATNPYM